MTLRVCTQPGCPTLVEGGGRCPTHRRSPERTPNSNDRGYDARWRRTRKAYLNAHPHCERCGQPSRQVHHRDGHGPLGPRGHDDTNLEALCDSCHAKHTGLAQPGGWHARSAPPQYYDEPIIIVCGPAGVGKTAVCEQLVKLRGWTHLGPDMHPYRWTWVTKQVGRARHPLVECVAIHSTLRRMIRERDARIYALTAPPETIRARLIKRGEPKEDVAMLMASPVPIGYETTIVPDAVVDANQPPAQQAEFIVRHYLGGGG